MAFTTTATQAEFRAAWECTVKLEECLEMYASGAATKDKPGRFTEVEVQVAIDNLQAALIAIES